MIAKSSFLIAFLLLVGFVAGASAHQTGKHGTNVTVQGEILDSACYFTHDARGPEHSDCASKCVQKGIPMALVDTKGDLYLLNEDHDNPKGYAQAKTMAAKNVTITGKLVQNKNWKILFVETVK
jgi:hypothetical protein